jgi:hypothetical protein
MIILRVLTVAAKPIVSNHTFNTGHVNYVLCIEYFNILYWLHAHNRKQQRTTEVG